MAAEIDASGIAGPGCLVWVGVAMGRGSVGGGGFDGSGVTPAVPRPIGPHERAMSAPVLPPLAKADIKRAMASLGSVRYVPGMVDEAPTALRLFEETLTRFQAPADSNSFFSVADIDCN
jgi:hypothetical protein